MTKSARSRREPLRRESTKVPGKYIRTARLTQGQPEALRTSAMAAKWCPKTTHLLVGTKSSPIVHPLGGSGAKRIERQNFYGDELAVEPVAHGDIDATSGHHQPHGIDLLAAMQCDSRHCKRSQHNYAGIQIQTAHRFRASALRSCSSPEYELFSPPSRSSLKAKPNYCGEFSCITQLSMLSGNV